jgi:hypothetical protein
MPLVGLGAAFAVAAACDLAGNDKTRSFTRTGFWMVLLYEMGLPAGLRFVAEAGAGVL